MLSVLNVRSESHNSCEDSVYTKEEPRYIFGVIADGCSTGNNSHFASQAIAYIAQYQLPTDITSNEAGYELKRLLSVLKTLMKLDNMSLLSTCTLFVYDKDTKRLRIRLFGDGVYYVNDVEYVVEQNNTPDYIGYHLDDKLDQFGEYLNKYPELTYQNVDKFIICSDGIGRIERSPLLSTPTLNPQDLLFALPNSENYLTRMWNKIKRDKWYLSDDLTIVSYVS